MLDRPLRPATACLLLALCGALLPLAALALQYLGGLAPCHLCVLQRYPYLALIALGLIGWRFRPRLMLALAALLLIGEAGLAAYHVGVEQGWFALPMSCLAGESASSVEELRRMLSNAPPACDQIAFTFLGLSLAGWNLIAALGLALFALAAALRANAAASVRSGRLAGREG
ncbi:MAG: disulfide bond formation protein B [Geminicoccales bacterium]